MPTLSFIQVKEPEHIAELANFAEGIFREYFSKIHSAEKVEYLCKYLLGTETLIRAIADEGYEYYFADDESQHVGFIGIKAREDEGCLFLSKLYVASDFRGLGYGRQSFEFVKRRARDFGVSKIRLTCARDNLASLDKYDHMGFVKVGRVDDEVGPGVQMNDFILEYPL